MSFRHYIRHDHESNGFRRLAEKQMDISNCFAVVVVVVFFFVYLNLVATNSSMINDKIV